MFTDSKTGYTMYHYLFLELNTSLSKREREGGGHIDFVLFSLDSSVPEHFIYIYICVYKINNWFGLLLYDTPH